MWRGVYLLIFLFLMIRSMYRAFGRRGFRKKQMVATAGGHLCDSSHGAPTPTGTQSAGDPVAT
jgi:hypothetical protein